MSDELVILPVNTALSHEQLGRISEVVGREFDQYKRICIAKHVHIPESRDALCRREVDSNVPRTALVGEYDFKRVGELRIISRMISK